MKKEINKTITLEYEGHTYRIYHNIQSTVSQPFTQIELICKGGNNNPDYFFFSVGLTQDKETIKKLIDAHTSGLYTGKHIGWGLHCIAVRETLKFDEVLDYKTELKLRSLPKRRKSHV
jgi:hypothetical protein